MYNVPEELRDLLEECKMDLFDANAEQDPFGQDPFEQDPFGQDPFEREPLRESPSEYASEHLPDFEDEDVDDELLSERATSRVVNFEMPMVGLVDENRAMDAREAGFWTLKDSIVDFRADDPFEPVRETSTTEPAAPAGNETSENDISFDVRFRGYDREQVWDYIDELTADYNKICTRCAKLEKENVLLHDGTDTIGTAILKAENLAKQIISKAEAEAEVIRQNAANPSKPYRISDFFPQTSTL